MCSIVLSSTRIFIYLDTNDASRYVCVLPSLKRDIFTFLNYRILHYGTYLLRVNNILQSIGIMRYIECSKKG